VDDAIENGVGECGLTDDLVPLVDRQLAGDKCRVATVEEARLCLSCENDKRPEENAKISAFQRFALPRPILVVVAAGSVPMFGQAPSPMLKPSAAETGRVRRFHVSSTVAEARRHLNVRTSGAVPKNVKEVAHPQPSGTYYKCLELPQPDSFSPSLGRREEYDVRRL
jgi:hypothetical protein